MGLTLQSRAELEEYFQGLLFRRQNALEVVEQIVALLTRADERRRADPEDRRWNKTLDHLEENLVEARARLDAAEVEIQQVRREHPDVCPVYPPTAMLQPARKPTPKPDPAATVRQLAEAPVERLAALSLDEIAKLQEQIAAENQRAQAVAPGVTEQLLSGSGPMNDEQRRRHALLRNACAKIERKEMRNMTAQEAVLLLACHDVLERKADPTPNDVRLKALLGPALHALRARARDVSAPSHRRKL